MPTARDVRLSAWTVDLAAGAALGAVLVATTRLVAQGGPLGDLGAGGAALLAADGLLLTWRRAAPVAVLTATGTLTLVYYALLLPDGPVLLAFLAAAYTVTAEGRRWTAAAGSAAVLVGIGVLEYLLRDGFWPDTVPLLGQVLSTLLALAAGEVVRARRSYLAAAARARDAAARNRANEERLRLARELHDTLAHSLSLITVQANTGLYLATRDDALAALREVKAVAAAATRDVRSTVRRVRTGGPVEPGPGAGASLLDAVAGLAERVRATGLRVEVADEGAAAPLPPPVGHAAFRIVQEALTNTVRHAGATAATVRIRYTADAVLLEVGDDGRAPDEPDPTGSGIHGMRERAAAVGGHVGIGVNGTGGLQVSARLPYTAAGER
jgi:signal transduction histidine kinase